MHMVASLFTVLLACRVHRGFPWIPTAFPTYLGRKSLGNRGFPYMENTVRTDGKTWTPTESWRWWLNKCKGQWVNKTTPGRRIH